LAAYLAFISFEIRIWSLQTIVDGSTSGPPRKTPVARHRRSEKWLLINRHFLQVLGEEWDLLASDFASRSTGRRSDRRIHKAEHENVAQGCGALYRRVRTG